MKLQLRLTPIVPKSPLGLSREELRSWLSVGKNEIKPIASRFNLTRLCGCFPEEDVWAKILGVQPADEPARTALREPLGDTAWISWVTRTPASTLRAKIAANSFDLDPGVQLGDTKGTSEPRLRRWNRQLILSQLHHLPAPSVTVVMPIADDQDEAGSASPSQPDLSVFAAIAGGTAA